MRNRFVLELLALLLVSCSTDVVNDSCILVNADNQKIVESPSPSDFIGSKPRYICLLNNDDMSYSFSSIAKVVIKDNIYILEEGNKKLLIFNIDGEPIRTLAYRGRGPKEYLQITDFDVDAKGNILIADAQKKLLYKYSPDLDLISTHSYEFEINKIACISEQKYVCQVASWDKSDYSGAQLVITDSLFRVEKVLTQYPKIKDSNFEFHSEISECDTSLFYCDPISDYLYEISRSGELCNSYYFDFGQKRVPNKYKVDIDHFYEKINKNYQFIFRTYRVDQNYIVVGIHMNTWKAAIFNRKEHTIAYFDKETSGFNLVGQCALGSVWTLSKAKNKVDVPSYVQEWVNDDRDILMILPNENTIL